MADIEALGLLADKADNLIAAGSINFDAKLSLECTIEGLKDISAGIKSYYADLTGENPWQ